jgi:hypothetical protein
MQLPIIHLHETASGGGGGGLETKAGVVLNAAFSGNPKKTAVILFATPFADANYSLTIGTHTQNNSTFSCDFESKTATGFVINAHANNVSNLLDVSWTAIKNGES